MIKSVQLNLSYLPHSIPSHQSIAQPTNDLKLTMPYPKTNRRFPIFNIIIKGKNTFSVPGMTNSHDHNVSLRTNFDGDKRVDYYESITKESANSPIRPSSPFVIDSMQITIQLVSETSKSIGKKVMMLIMFYPTDWKEQMMSMFSVVQIKESQ